MRGSGPRGAAFDRRFPRPLRARREARVGPGHDDVQHRHAWPVDGDGRAFFVNQAGDVLATADGDYGGDREPHFSAAFAPDSVGIIGSTALASGASCDRHTWKQAG